MQQKKSEMNDANIRAIFENAADFYAREVTCSGKTLIAYAIDGLTSGGDISEYIIKPIREFLQGDSMLALYEQAMRGAVVNSVAKPCEDVTAAANFLVNGFCVVLFPGVGAIAFEAKTGEKRSISSPELENTAKGAKDAFVETVRTNTSLVRRHLRTPDLRLREIIVGRRTLTNVTVAWIDGLTNPQYVTRVCERLNEIDIDGLLTPAAVEEYITGSRFTAFPMLQYTQRTDRFCEGILDGRVGLLVDGIPLGYLVPVDIGYLMSSMEDYSRDFITATATKILRYAALLLDLLLPALYVAMTTFHWDLLPASIAQVISQGRENVPFSPVWEILMLLVAFELLQESGVHLPQSIGQSVSVIGGIVVGTVGVEAGLISSLALIAVSVAGVCGFVLPNRDLADAIRVWRFLMAVLASLLGLWGIVAGITALVIRLASLRSLGLSYLRPFEPGPSRPRMFRNKLRSDNLSPLDERRQR